MGKDNETGFSLADMLREEIKKNHPMKEGLEKDIIGMLRKDGTCRFEVDNINVEKFAIIDWAHDNGLCAYDSGIEMIVYLPSK